MRVHNGAGDGAGVGDRCRAARARFRGFARRGEDGLTLLELVVAISCFAIITGGVAATIDSGLTLTRDNRERSVAANLASQEMDTVRSIPFTSIAPRTVTQNVDGTSYTITRELTWVSRTATNGPCDGANQNPELLRVRVVVTWPNMRGVAPVSSDTTMAPPIGAYSANSGHIAVKVLDGAAAGAFGTSVQITGPTTKSQPTNDDGCAFFAFLTPGTYTVALNTIGYVDRQGLQTPSQTVSVTSGNVSSVQFDYDQASALSLTLAPSAGGTPPNDLAISLGNTSFLPTGVRLYAGTGLTRSIGSLFPAADGYTAWGGSCADADPEGDQAGNAGPYWPGGMRPAPFAAPAGGTTTGTVPLESAALTVMAGGLPVSGATVVATHAADSVCASGETHSLGTTDATGALTTALPYGTWQLSVTGRNALTTWPSLVLDPTATTTPAVEVDVQ
ncbi:MAG TPA: prepilin-type N-terminal cleavage/methylation domain-containing protein [Acidimicrobiia bacterium]|nr:prepilin-type N-terminal cleavage/methylation domain-containing protein [Acidimicrobiia bacterium]